ncbi:hypothetical protein NliqN6_2095 [Naganishia liquefaciens]|uniref:Flavin reductase like domain-containing protein n=1 Tax=Naganishia liquefaciens TaxID=104408 RepID=A0A8H3TR91_9TREE|nr:hypothetical protein NliqN6_2095 [Naganishia liquefaciens]
MSRHPPFAETQNSRPDFDREASFAYSKTPQVDWKPGQGLNNLPGAEEFAATSSFREIDVDSMENKGPLYKLMTWAITPRPVALVSTMDESGVANLAPISYFNEVNHDPPTIMISVVSGTTATGLKDTASNIANMKEFCVSMISEPLIEAANYSSINTPGEVDEYKLCGLTKRQSGLIRTPHVAESAFSMECILAHSYPMYNDAGKHTATAIFGRIKKFHIKESVLDPNDPGKLVPEKYRVISRLGGLTYARSVSGYELQRPVWEQVKETEEVKAALGRSESKM